MPTIVLLPGMEGSGSFFSPLIEALGSTVETQVISYPHDQALNYTQLSQFVKESLPKDSPFVLLGESFSGPIALSIAAAKPAGLQAIILASSFVRSPIPVPEAFRNLISRFPVRLIPKQVVSRYLLGSYSNKELEARLDSVLSNVGGKVWQERLLSILNADFSKELSEIDVPMLYIRATQDKIIPQSAFGLICQHHPNTIVAEIEGPHFILQANPAASASCILEFLTNLCVIPKTLTLA